ncbi:MAG: adenosylcobyric acid synthase [Paracoccaceae bacterium]|jgi:adenosylcobyric acid synthase
MTGRAIMVQGTCSDAGKSLLVAGLCRAALNRGMRPAPFKPQNMSNNAAACDCGGEIGRAQALQARACGLAPHPDMNPVLLKPQSDRSAQLILRGKVVGEQLAADFGAQASLLPEVLGSFARLTAAHDIVIVEGAGSPAETNLRARDIANMGFARAANVPVLLAGDIDRGGVIAALVGHHAVMDAGDRAQVIGFCINRFRGDPSLFDAGLADIATRTGWRSFGMVPWLPAAARLPAEDAVALERPAQARPGAGLRIAVPMLPRIANFDDLDPLRADPGTEVTFIPPGRPLPRDADIIVIPGTKSTLADLAFLRHQGWDIDILAHVRAGGRVLGICGGYQMLARRIEDPLGIDGAPGAADGLGLLDIDIVMAPDKTVRPVAAVCARGGDLIRGYEIHSGRAAGPGLSRPFALIDGRPEGATSPDGRVEGVHLHGLFTADGFRDAWLARAGAQTAGSFNFDASIEDALNDVAAGLEAAMDLNALFSAARRPLMV